jgi:hypothetical protein
MIFVPQLQHYKATPTGKVRRLIDQSTKLSITSAEQTASVIVTVSALDSPPARIAVRQDSIEQLKDKIRTLSEEMEEFEETSKAVDIKQAE